MKTIIWGILLLLSTNLFAQRKLVEMSAIEKSKLLTILLEEADSKIEEDPYWKIATDIFTPSRPGFIRTTDIFDIENPAKEKLFGYSKSNLKAVDCFERAITPDSKSYSCDLDVHFVISISDDMGPYGEIKKDITFVYKFQFYPESLDLNNMVMKSSNIALMSVD